MIAIYTIDKNQFNFIPQAIKQYFYIIEDKAYFSRFTFLYLKKNRLDILLTSLKQTILSKDFYKKGKLKISLPLSNVFQDRIPKNTLIEFILFANSIDESLQICAVKRHLSENKTKYPPLQINDFQLDLMYAHDYINSQRVYLLKITKIEAKSKFRDKISWLLNSDYKFLIYTIQREPRK